MNSTKRKYISKFLLMLMVLLVIPSAFNPIYINLAFALLGLVVINKSFDFKSDNKRNFIKSLSTGIFVFLLSVSSAVYKLLFV